MKKNKINFICCFILVMLICFSSVSFAGVTISGILTTTKVEENKQATMRSEQGVLIFEGLSYDSDSASYYYMDGGNKVEFSGRLKVSGKNRNLNILVNTKGEMYIRLPEGITSTDLRSAEITLDNGEIISLNNIKIEERTVTQKEKNALARLWGFLTDAVNEIAKLVEEILNEILLPLGDGLLYVVSRAVGEPVTIDRLIFNKVDKVDVNFWEAGTEGSLKNIMGSVVSYWYNIFRKIAIVVYMIVLVGIGVTIMLNSTAQKKAQYKEALTSWVVGVAILFLFPYVMKYLVKLNNAVVGIMESRIAAGNSSINNTVNRDFLKTSESDAYAPFGKDEFVYLMIGKDHYNAKTNEINLSKIKDSMMKTRVLSQKLNKIILTVVYFILIGQTYVLLFAYYKRAFMIAFLITIFPLVAMSYAIDKLGDKKAQSFGIWFKEYTVNVIVQMFHAAVYYLIVNVSVNTFMESNGANWLFMILSVLFLFEGEKILRNIFNVKSSAGTMGDLATTGIAVMGVASQTAKMFGGKKAGGNHMSEDDTQAEKDIDERMSTNSGDNLAAQNARAAVNAGGGASGSTSDTNTTTTTASTTSSSSTQGVSASQAARDKIAKEIFSRKKTAGIFSKGATGIGKVVGGAMGATYGLATGKGIGGAMEGATKGSVVGQAAMTPLSTFANKIDDRISGNRVAASVQNGAMDEYVEQYGALTSAEAAMARAEAYARASEGEEISDEEVIEKYGTKKQEIMREALDVYAKELAKHGSSRAKLSFEEYLDTHHL